MNSTKTAGEKVGRWTGERSTARRWLFLLTFSLSHLLTCSAKAIIISGNETAPAALVAPVLQWTGQWQGLTGTPVGPRQFLTAGHVGGSIGDTFTVGGLSYTATALVSRGDLALWTVDGTFATWAPLDLERALAPFPVLMVGRGTQRGAEVFAANGTSLGYKWGGRDGSLSWGINEAASSPNYLRTIFDRDQPFEGQASSGDSGGSIWSHLADGPRLAGIIVGVSAGAAGNDPAALFGGLTYAINLSGNAAWLTDEIISVPEPSAPLLLMAGLVVLHAAFFTSKPR